MTKKSKKGNFKVYRKAELLDRWHFKNNPRTPPIFALADVGYGFQDLSENMIEYSKKYNFNGKFFKMQVGTFGFLAMMNEFSKSCSITLIAKQLFLKTKEVF